MLRVYNATARHVDQAGRRKGSIAVYLEPWHSDVLDFLENQFALVDRHVVAGDAVLFQHRVNIPLEINWTPQLDHLGFDPGSLLGRLLCIGGVGHQQRIGNQ